MPQYMLLMYHPAEEDQERRTASRRSSEEADPDGGLSREQMAEEYQRWAKYTQELKDAGAWVANQGLQGVEAATTVRVRNDETQITDGPFAETKEFLAGFFLIDVEDLDTALKYAARIPSAEWGSVEVRPVWG